MKTRMTSSARTARGGQQGAATLVVVMLLFFVISLTAAYTARNLIFEQRTSANQYRSTQAVEAAEAGLEWATAMLNGGRINDACEPTTDTTRNTFRQRYFLDPVSGLSIDPVGGFMNRKFQSDGTSFLRAACQFDGTRWRCNCPVDGDPSIAAPTGVGPFPAFSVRFNLDSTRPGMTRVEINGCNSFDIACVTRVNGGNDNFCQATLCSLLALHNGLRLIPSAPLTAKGQLTATAAFTVVNRDAASGGLTVHTGQGSSSPTLMGPSGTPPERTRAENDGKLDDTALNLDSVDCVRCMFTSVFSLRPSLYAEQPALVTVDCGAGGCTATDVNAAVALNPERMIRLTGLGGLTVGGTLDIGGANAPVVLWVQDGPVTLDSSYVGKVFGLIYAPGATLLAGEIRGAIVSSGDITGTGGSVSYDPAILKQLMQTTGSFVRVPGTWRDFP